VITEVSTIETHDEIDLAELMDRIRARAEERRATSLIDTAAILYRLLNNVGEIAWSSADASREFPLEPDFQEKEAYDVADFLGFNDRTFVRNAYRGILKRDPDDAGYAEFLRALRSGRLNKIDILAKLRFSPEGRSHNVPVSGLNGKARLRQLYRVPILGYFAELGVSLLRLPALVANHRQLEAHTAAQDERLAAYLGDATARMAQQIDSTAAGFAQTVSELRDAQRQIAQLNQQQIKSLFREQRELTEDQNRLKQEITKFRNHIEGQFAADKLTDEIQLEKHQELQEFVTNQIVQKLQRTRTELILQERRLTMMLEKRGAASANAPLEAQPAGNADELMDLLYSSLEDQLRGSRVDIKDELQVYLPVLSAAKIRDGILDVGCGRGEWLELLRDEGLAASGIDTNRLAVDQCARLQLDAREAEAITHLQTLPDSSLNCVTAFHFVEHLPLQTLARFLDESLRVLRTGGLLIIETPNPENLIVGSCNFYFDPTHRNPLPQLTMQCILESRGFGRLETIELHPMIAEKLKGDDELTRRFNEYFYGPMDYAIVARKV
jgi:O-antigen chain-terminating methyltransferase